MSKGVVSILTGATCSFSCWYAEQQICRCSCGGINHGILLVKGARQPVRQSRKLGHMYRLEMIGSWRDIKKAQRDWNKSVGWKTINVIVRKKITTIGDPYPSPFVKEDRYHSLWGWSNTEKGIPARVDRATKDQREKWAELAVSKDESEVYMLWVRVDMPAGDFCIDDCDKCENLFKEIAEWRANYGK